uniref:Uncharacterized protein n=1 Tax=Mola mola TaxID=94237 RepID=A0A3Q4B6C5_MOLML
MPLAQIAEPWPTMELVQLETEVTTSVSTLSVPCMIRDQASGRPLTLFSFCQKEKNKTK